MNAVTKEESTALTLPERAAVALGAADYEVKIKAKVAASTDITAVIDPAGREQAHRIGMDLLKLRTGIIAVGEAAREDANAFSKAILGKQKELVALIAPEETRVFGLRDAFDERTAAEKAAKIAAEQARKDALIAAERARTEAIQRDIQAIRDTVANVGGKGSEAIGTAIDDVGKIVVTEARFAEFADDAIGALSETMQKLSTMRDDAITSEAAALAAEEARKAEATRIEQEREELAKLRAENERIANEQAAERQRLADRAAAQEAEARRVSEQAAANLKADRDAQELAIRLVREKSDRKQAERDEAAAEQQRQLDAQQAEIDAKRAAFAREQEEAAARVEDDLAAAVQHEIDRQAAEILCQQIPVDHAEAPEMNAALDAAIARIEPVEKFASDDLTRCNATVASLLADNLPRPESCCARDARIDAEVVEVSDNDIINVVMWEFDWSNDEATKRMKAIDYAAAWQERLAEAE